MLAEIRQKFKFLENMLGKTFSKLNLSANQYTLLSIVFAFSSFYFLIDLNFVPAFIFFVFAVVLDLIDGAVARIKGEASKKGAYLDTICDRYVEAIILFGFLFLPLPLIVFPSYFWIFLSLFGSLMTTYSKAAVKEKELVIKKFAQTFLGRTERVIFIALAMFLGIFDMVLVIYPIIILAIFSNFSALQRIFLNFNSAEG